MSNINRRAILAGAASAAGARKENRNSSPETANGDSQGAVQKG